MEYVIFGGLLGLGLWLGWKLRTINQTLDCILQKEEIIMATLQDFEAAIARVDAKVDEGNTGITGIESDIADLKAQIATGGMNADAEASALAKVAELEARVAAQAERLRAIDDATPGTPPVEPPAEPPVV